MDASQCMDWRMVCLKAKNAIIGTVESKNDMPKF